MTEETTFFEDEDDDLQLRAEELRQFAARADKRFILKFIDRDELDRLVAAPKDNAADNAALECLDIIDWGDGKWCGSCAGPMDSDELALVIHVAYAGQKFEQLDGGEVMAVCYGCAFRRDALSIASFDLHRRSPRAEIRCEGVTIGNA